MKKTLLLLALLPLCALAGVNEDITLIRSVLPAGSDLAQVAIEKARGVSDEDALKSGRANYLLRDLNGDGKQDLIVISEVNPTFRNWDTGETCDHYDMDAKCDIVPGQRSLLVLLGDANGGLDLFLHNAKAIRNADEGGVFGDPLEGLSVTSRGSIRLDFYGGSAWRWSYGYVFQFRETDLFLIGENSYAGWNGDMRADTKSENFLTGDVIETHQKDGDAPVKTKKYKVPVKPLVKMRDFQGIEM